MPHEPNEPTFTNLSTHSNTPLQVQQWLWDAGDDHADAKVFGKDKGVRAFRDKPQRVPHPTDFESIFEVMKRPTPVLKFGSLYACLLFVVLLFNFTI